MEPLYVRHDGKAFRMLTVIDEFTANAVREWLGHSSPQTTARYVHLSQDPVHQASESIGHFKNRKSDFPRKRDTVEKSGDTDLGLIRVNFQALRARWVGDPKMGQTR